MAKTSGTNGSADIQAELAGSRRGDARARAALMERIERRDPKDLAFLLSAVAEIDDPKVLHHLANVTLDDERVPDGGAPGGRRLCDLAVEAFTTRLGLSRATPAGGAYGPEERERVRQQMRSTIPM